MIVNFEFSENKNEATMELNAGQYVQGPPGPQGEKGDKGDTGPQGVGIKSINGMFGVSSSNSVEPTSWRSDAPAMTQDERYLWSYESILYDDGTRRTSDRRVIGVYGEKGDPGAQGPQGETGPKGETGPQGEQGPKGETGEQGPKGEQGAKGDKGDKGDTGEQGPPGKDGADGQPGKDGADGKDGLSVTHEWLGTVLRITSASGTSHADLRGPKGDKGDPGSGGGSGGGEAPPTDNEVVEALVEYDLLVSVIDDAGNVLADENGNIFEW